MQLSKIQADIIGILKLKADQDLKSVARKLKVTEKTVRYHLEYLIKHEVISRAHFLNLYPLGFRYVNVYFSVASQEKGALDQLIAHLIRSPHVTWLAELGGDFHYGAAFALPKFENTLNELLDIPQRLVRAIFEKSLNVHLSLKMYPLKLLGSRTITPGDLKYGDTGEESRLDEIDKKILSILSLEPNNSLRDIAKKVGRSPASISARMQELKSKHIYKGEWFRVNFEALGFSTYKVLIYTRGIDPKLTQQLHAFCRDHRNIDYLVECFGAWDFEVGIVAQSISDVMATTREIYDQFGDSIRVAKVLPLLRTLKWRQVPW